MAIPRAAIMGVAGLVLILGAFLMTRSKATDEPAATPPAATQSAAGAGSAPAAGVAEEEAPAESAGSVGEAGPSTGGGGKSAKEVPAAPRDVARALGRKKVVVLLLSQSGAADDEVTRQSVKRLEAERGGRFRHKVALFSDRIHNVGEYRGVIGSLGVSQAPSIVIVPPSLEARLLEGYTDYRSLRQHVADALR